MMLLVDDDPGFLEAAQESLDTGRGVFFAANASQAMDLMQSVGSAFSVVMVDLDLPGTDGFQLIRELHIRYPDLPTIAISGVMQAQVLESSRAFGAVETLRKPITGEWNQVLARTRARCHKV
jgi:CheY-like chemotaxis protein